MTTLKHSLLCASVIATSLLAYSAPSQAFDLGGLAKAVSGSAAGGSSDPDGFLKQAQVAEKMMTQSTALMEKALLSKTKQAQLADQEKAANAEPNAAERDAKLAKIAKDKDAALAETLSSDDAASKIKGLDSDRKASLASAAFNFSLALLQDQALSVQAPGLVSSMSTNPAMLSKLSTVKDVAVSVSHQISSAASIASKMPVVFSAVGVKAPESKDDKPKDVKTVDNL